MSYRALTDVLLGNGPSAKPGDILPDTFTDMAGHPVPIDFERLVEAGAAEKVSEATDEESYSDLTVPELKALADERDVEVASKAPKAKLVKALKVADKDSS